MRAACDETMWTACAFTGHRPPRHPFGARDGHPDAVALREALHGEIVRLALSGITTFFSGMAQGADQWAAAQVLSLRDTCGLTIRLVAVLPCREQDRRWPQQVRAEYRALLARADEVVLTAERYAPGCMQLRNRWLVDHADILLAVYDGTRQGGTAYTVYYARQQGRHITSIHPDSRRKTEYHE